MFPKGRLSRCLFCVRKIAGSLFNVRSHRHLVSSRHNSCHCPRSRARWAVMSSGHRSSSPITRCRTQRHRLFHPRSTPEWCDAWVDKAVDSRTLKRSIGWQTEHAQEVRQLAVHSSEFSGGEGKAMDPLALFISQRAVQTFCMSSRPPTRPLFTWSSSPWTSYTVRQSWRCFHKTSLPTRGSSI